MRRVLGAAVVAVVVWAGAARAPAGADGSAPAGTTPCSFSAEFDLDPGLSVQPNSGSFTTGGETGTMSCSGPVEGRQPSQPGTFGAEGRYGTTDPDSCLTGGEGTGVQSFTIPTEQGPVHVVNPITFTYHPGSSTAPRPIPGPIASGEFRGPRYSGTFDVTALKGDCVTGPVTRVRLTAQGRLE